MSSASKSSLSQDFIEFAVAKEVLRFGEFTTKAGRLSPYFFNAGLFNTGGSLSKLCEFYALNLLNSVNQTTLQFDMLFGPAYKGIPLVAGTAMQLANKGRDVPYAFNRKEAKDHGEGGTLVGASLEGRVIIVDDVISAGTSVRESVDIIRAHGAEPAGVLIAIDRMEKGVASKEGQFEKMSAVQQVESQFGIPVMAIANLQDLMRYLATNSQTHLRLAGWYEKVKAYRQQYGV